MGQAMKEGKRRAEKTGVERKGKEKKGRGRGRGGEREKKGEDDKGAVKVQRKNREKILGLESYTTGL